MPAQQQSSVWTAYLSATTGNVPIGSCMIPDSTGTYYVIATDSARTASSRTTCVAGIAITAGDPNNPFVEIQTVGPCPPSITGLGVGAAGPIIVGTDGRLARKTTPTPTDVVAGKCDADGWAYLSFTSRDGSNATATHPSGTPGQIQTNLDNTNFGAKRETYTDSTGETRAEKDLYQTATSEDGTKHHCVWSRYYFPGDTVYPAGDAVSIGALQSNGGTITIADWDNSKPPGLLISAAQYFLFESGLSTDADWCGLLGFQKLPTGPMTGTGWMAYPNFIVSGSFAPEYVDKAARFGNGTGILCLEGAATNPSANPTGNIACYSDASNGYYFTYRTPSGIVAVPLNTITNVGAGASLAKAKSGINVDLKTLTAGSGITITPNADDVEIAATGASQRGLVRVDVGTVDGFGCVQIASASQVIGIELYGIGTGSFRVVLNKPATDNDAYHVIIENRSDTTHTISVDPTTGDTFTLDYFDNTERSLPGFVLTNPLG